jgi:plasmid stabilization system protein ParE
MGAWVGRSRTLKLVYSPAARLDLLRIRQFYAELGSHRGLRLAARLRAELKLLKRHPRLGQRIDDPLLGDIEMRRLIVDELEVRYAVANGELRILRVWHGREHR